MLNLPVFDTLEIQGYGLYPGRDGAGGLKFSLQPGMTLVIGANGLGKSTLIAILFRLVTGPFDIPGLAGRTDLGNLRLRPTPLPSSSKGLFSQRVMDGAAEARATVSFKLGKHTLQIERSLKDLSLVSFEIDGKAQGLEEETSFQKAIIDLVGLWAFGDWILLLRHIVFYFEDRRALVWDASAQRQLLRLLFLPIESAQRWTEDERTILELDSRSRNLHAAVTREERALAQTEIKLETGNDVRGELRTLQKLQDVDEEKLEHLEDGLVAIDSSRQSARLNHLEAEQQREVAFRELERIRLKAIEARFPKRSETARFILAQLMTEHTCLVCESNAPKAAAAYQRRISHKHCVVCDTDLSDTEVVVSDAQVSAKRLLRATEMLESADARLEATSSALQVAQREFNSHLLEIQTLKANISERSNRIDGLVRRMPPSETELHKQRGELASMRARVEMLRTELVQKREVFSAFVAEVGRDLARRSNAIKKTFDEFAQGFLLEDCRLIWSPHRDRVGETGELIEFPAFELEMSGSDFASPVRRSGPEQVSESQREFIDLAFRMALMAVASKTKAGSLVIDAPESSLDAVFVERAANVLGKFSDPERGNRLLITSNLIEGRLIPLLLRKAGPARERKKRIVDLFELAAPTRAVVELRKEYDKVRSEVYRASSGR